MPPRTESSARRKADRHSVSRNTAGWQATRSSTHPTLPRTGHCKSLQRSRKKPRSRAPRTSFFLPYLIVSRLIFLLPQFTALPFHEPLQIVEQLRISLAQDFHQERERQRGSRSRIQQLTKGVPGILAAQFVTAEPGDVAECPAFLRPS